MSGTQQTTGGTCRYCTFFVDGEYFGVDVLKVQEVIRSLEMTSVPTAPETISGLINLRGQIVTAIDMRTRLGRGRRGEETGPMHIVVRIEEEAISLLVDEIDDVLEVSASLFENPPDGMQPEQRELIEGVYKLDNRLLMVLKTDRVMQSSRG